MRNLIILIALAATTGGCVSGFEANRDAYFERRSGSSVESWQTKAIKERRVEIGMTLVHVKLVRPIRLSVKNTRGRSMWRSGDQFYHFSDGYLTSVTTVN